MELPLPNLATLDDKPSWVNRAGRVDRSACFEVRASEVWRGVPPDAFYAAPTEGGREAVALETVGVELLLMLQRQRKPRKLKGDFRTGKANAMCSNLRRATPAKRRGPGVEWVMDAVGPDQGLPVNPNRGAAREKVLGLPEAEELPRLVPPPTAEELAALRREAEEMDKLEAELKALGEKSWERRLQELMDAAGGPGEAVGAMVEGWLGSREGLKERVFRGGQGRSAELSAGGGGAEGTDPLRDARPRRQSAVAGDGLAGGELSQCTQRLHRPSAVTERGLAGRELHRGSVPDHSADSVLGDRPRAELWQQALRVERWRWHARGVQHFLVCPGCGRKVSVLLLPMCTPGEWRDAKVAQRFVAYHFGRGPGRNRPGTAGEARLAARYGVLWMPRRLLCGRCLGVRYGEAKRRSEFKL